MKKISLINIVNLAKPLLAAVVFAGSMGISHAKADGASIDDVLKHFENIVFGSEYEGVAAATQIQKWVGPVRVGVNAMTGQVKPKAGGGRELKLERVRPSNEQIELVRKHLTTLVKMTGVKNEAADEKANKPANLIIRFLPRLAMMQPFVAHDCSLGGTRCVCPRDHDGMLYDLGAGHHAVAQELSRAGCTGII